MAFFQPTLPPYDAGKWPELSISERGEQACRAWALQGYGTPLAVFVVYALKVVFYIFGWALFCTTSPKLGSLGSIASWWLHPIAFQKAILWSMLFEGLGLGCGSGPLTGRYLPPVGGFLYFLRPRTTKLPLFPKLPVLGGAQRSWLDVALYAALVVLLMRALCAPEPGLAHILPLVVLVPVIGLADKTIFLALRSEHYWVTLVVFAAAADWVPGAKAVQLALWFWAGMSKLNHHFPTVVCVMVSNGPFTRFAWLRRRMYRDYPRDLRPSRIAVWLAHGGTALELGVPIVLGLFHGGTGLLVGMALMLLLHVYITSNVPLGVPIEWNFMVVYGGFALFWAHPDRSVLDIAPPALAVFLALMLVGVPLVGNLVPRRISFLLSMRYYAGNWANSVWLFRGESHRKLERLVKSAPWVQDQLERLYDRTTTLGLISRVFAFRMMHLHGRLLPELIPKAVHDVSAYRHYDGELIAGLALGWNFGEGHLHDERLLAAIQQQCGFEPGELRCVFVESQPLGKATLSYRIVDAASGELERGEVEVARLRERQPWEAPVEA